MLSDVMLRYHIQLHLVTFHDIMWHSNPSRYHWKPRRRRSSWKNGRENMHISPTGSVNMQISTTIFPCTSSTCRFLMIVCSDRKWVLGVLGSHHNTTQKHHNTLDDNIQHFMTFHTSTWHFIHFMTISDICSHFITIQSLSCHQMSHNVIKRHKMSLNIT